MNAATVPEKIRAFVAIFPTESIIARLKSVQMQLESVLPPNAVRWTKPEQIHLTLQFLGSVERERLGNFKSAIELTVQKHSAFRLNSEMIGCFPNPRRPRIVWAGLAGELDPLKWLKENLDEALSVSGYMPEKRTFHPHLTIGRVAQLRAKDAGRLGKELAKFEHERFGEWNVQTVHLMQSVLSPKGSEYRELNAFRLGKN